MAEFEGLLCADTNANHSLCGLRGQAAVLLEGRRVSGVFYFFSLSDEIARRVGVDEHRTLVPLDGAWEKGLTVRPFASVSTVPLDGAWEKGLTVRPFASVSTNRTQRANLLSRTADSYRKTPASLGDGTRMMVTPAPFEFLGAKQYATGGPTLHESGDDMRQLYAGYENNPSSIEAMMCLELALIEMEINPTNAWKTLDAGIERFHLADIDFRSDTQFRLHLHESMNFDRPECAILYLAGKCAEEQGEKARAVERYTTLIERSPGSPLAWEACAKLMRLASTGTEVKRLQELKQMLIDTYPLIWGCPREGVKLDSTTVPTAINALITKVADGIKE